MIKAVTLDLWDTIIQSEQGPIEPYVIMELESIIKTIERAVKVDMDELIKAYNSLVEYRGVFNPRVYAKLIIALLGLDINANIVEEALIAYENGGSQYKPRLIDGARELLQYAKGIGLKVAVITNTHFSSGTIHKILMNSGIGEYIDLIVSSADYEVLKPHPRIFQIALQQLNINPHEAVHIGDSCIRDVLGAYVAGLKPVLYARRQKSVDKCIRIPGLKVVYSLREAINVVEELLHA